MSGNRKKPISITLAAAVVLCIITFISGFLLSSFAFLDSRLEAANEKQAELNNTISEKNNEIKELNKTIAEKDENNIILGEKIQIHLETIDSLNAKINDLENDVTSISEAAINSDASNSSFVASFSSLSLSQQLILLVLLLVLIIFVISVTCGIIAAKTSPNKKSIKVKERTTEDSEAAESDDFAADDTYTSPKDGDDTKTQENTPSEYASSDILSDKTIAPVQKAIELLYSNKLEDNISDIGGFKFGIINFDEILSDKATAKSFGNAENGDFVAFMSSDGGTKKLYIIPGNMALSDSTVALRGAADLFDIINESGDVITHGSIKIKSVDSPAVFSCGAEGWAIQAKGKIVALGTRTLM